MNHKTEPEHIIEAVRYELILATKHFDAISNQLLPEPKEILEAMINNRLIIEPIPERQHPFESCDHAWHEDDNFADGGVIMVSGKPGEVTRGTRFICLRCDEARYVPWGARPSSQNR